MAAYLIRRLLLIIPTLLGIMVLNFLIVQAAPGGPVEQVIAKLQGFGANATQRIGGGGEENLQNMARPGEAMGSGAISSRYKGAQGLDPEFIKELEVQFGFDKPLWERFVIMVKKYAVFDFGKSYFRDQKVIDLVLQKLPVSISLGLWSTLLIYLISIPLGIRKAVKDGTPFDMWTSTAIIIGYAIPSFLFAVLLVVVFAGGRYFAWFPLRGIVSDNWQQMGAIHLVLDYLWHMVLPVLALVIGGFASLTMLTKNSFMDEINKLYVTAARAKGISEKKVRYGPVFRNAMLIVIAGFPAAFISILFTGSLLIEVIFSLDGLGLLGFESAISRDYPVMFGTLYFFTLLGLVMNIIGDITYTLVDPRIDFEKRDQ
jgi:microcin C transport system permease protein